MKTKAHLAFLITAALAARTYGGDAKVTLDSNNGSSAFVVRDAASNELARVQSDGKVGIGTTSPIARMDIGATLDGGQLGTIFGHLSEGNTTGDGTYLGVIGYSTYLTGDNVKSFSIEHHFYGEKNSSINFYRGSGTTGGFLTFNTNENTERMRIDASGNVGIGTTTPSRLLSLSGSQSIIRLYNSGTTTWTGLEMLANNGTLLANIGLDDASGRYGINMKSDGTEDFTITQNGNVGIGTTSPSYTLHVNGSVAGTSAYNNLSDARLKKDVQPINDALAIVEQLRGVTFNWDKTVDPTMTLDDRNHVGFLAQEVEAVLPQAVSTSTDARQTKSVAYSEVIPVLTEAIKQLKAENDALKARLDALEAKIK